MAVVEGLSGSRRWPPRAKLRHPDHEGLNRHVLAASAKFVGEQWRLVKPKGKRLPIDAAIALAMGLAVLARPPARRGDPVPRARA